jgi:hypothetical protein
MVRTLTSNIGAILTIDHPQKCSPNIWRMIAVRSDRHNQESNHVQIKETITSNISLESWDRIKSIYTCQYLICFLSLFFMIRIFVLNIIAALIVPHLISCAPPFFLLSRLHGMVSSLLPLLCPARGHGSPRSGADQVLSLQSYVEEIESSAPPRIFSHLGWWRLHVTSLFLSQPFASSTTWPAHRGRV